MPDAIADMSRPCVPSCCWFHSVPRYEEILLNAGQLQHLREGRNTPAVQGLLHYEQDRATDDYVGIGQMDVYIEALDQSDLGLE